MLLCSMEGISVLRAWLDGRQPYAQGVELVRQHSPAGQLVALLQQGENPFTRRKLRAELERLAAELQLATTQRLAGQKLATRRPAGHVLATTPPAGHVLATSRPQPGHVLATTEHVATPEAPAAAELVALRAARLQGFKRASYLKSRLELMSTDQERYTAACEIRQLWRDNARSWDDEAYFLQYGFMPPPAPVAPGLDVTNIALVTKRRNTLRTYVSGQRGTPEKKAAWSAELLELDRILDNEPV
jgi:hypothetical protein